MDATFVCPQCKRAPFRAISKRSQFARGQQFILRERWCQQCGYEMTTVEEFPRGDD